MAELATYFPGQLLPICPLGTLIGSRQKKKTGIKCVLVMTTERILPVS